MQAPEGQSALIWKLSIPSFKILTSRQCDEAKPTCTFCKRHGEACVYNIFTAPVTVSGLSEWKKVEKALIGAEATSSTSDQGNSSLAESHLVADICEIVEDRSERMTQLELLHTFHSHICTPFKVPQNQNVEAAWLLDVPRIAFQNDNLLYAMFAISATFVLRTQPLNKDLQMRRDRYLALNLHWQRKAIDNLSELNADAVSFTALLIQMNSFAMLHERINPLYGYEAVVEWLKTGPGSGQIFAMAATAARQNPDSKFKVLMNAKPAYDPNIEYHFRHPIPPQSQGLLEGHLAQVEGITSETREVYEKTLRYLGTINESNIEQKPSFYAARQIQGFSLLIPKAFVQFVEERRPLALAVLAHFFAMVALVQDPPWWVGDAAVKAISALSEVLNVGRETILEELEWPCSVARNKGHQ